MSWLNGRWAVLCLGFVLLGGVWLLFPGTGLRIYDGIGLPAPPYRYLSAPPGIHHNGGPPTAGRLVVSVSGGKLSFQDIATLETPPQARLVLQDNAFRIATSVKRITFTIRAIPPPAQPSSGTIEGNVYEFSAITSNGAPITLRKGQARVELRGTGSLGSPVIAQYNGKSWVVLQTGKFLGISIFTSDINRLGDFVLILPGKPAGTSSGGKSVLPFLLIGGLIVVVALVTLGLYFYRR